jgi:hypothetical protein
MNLQEQIPDLQAKAREALPGVRAAVAQLEIAAHVLEYFASHAEKERNTGTFIAFQPPGRELLKEIDELRGMLNCFCTLYVPPRK